MITPAPEPKVEPFAYKAQEFPASPITDQADLDANPNTLRVAWDVHTKAKQIADNAKSAAEKLANDPHLTDAGKRAVLTPVAASGIAALRGLLGKLDAADAAVLAEAGEVNKVAAPPVPTERHERLAEAFGRKTEPQRRQLLEAAMLGKDPALAEALAYSHPLLHGLGEQMVRLLRSEIETAKLDPVAVEQVKDRALKVNAVRRAVTTTIDALESAADHAQLKEAGVARLRLRDLTAKQKSDYIDAHGLAAFKKLPA